jgi:hypothetical protein
MNDPFMFVNGTRTAVQDQWTCRRAEINSQFQYWELGKKELAPPILYGTVTNNMVTVTAGNGRTTITFSATIQLPNKGTAPYAALFGMGGVSLNTAKIQAMGNGVAIINFNNNDIAQQNSGSSRGLGKFYTLYGATHTAGAMMAWAWGISRIIDVLEKNGTAVIDTTKLAITGCSRNGKGAFIAGAFDERIALTIPQESGSGGAANWRVSDWQGTIVQTLGEITGENVWFTDSLKQFNKYATKLPFDHHMLVGLVAPRGLLIIENTSQIWLGNLSCWYNSVAGNMIYQALTIPDHMGVSQVGNHNHCAFPTTQDPEVEAYVLKFLFGQKTNTAVMRSDQNYKFDNAMWVDWTLPPLGPPSRATRS